MKKWLPLIITLVFAGYLGSKMRPAKDSGFAFSEFGHLPVMANGRYQPLDSLARNSLLQLRDKASALTSADPTISASKRQISAAQWIAEMMFLPDVADTRPVFRIDNLELKQTLELPVEPDETKKTDAKHFSYAQLLPKLELLQQQAVQAAAIEAAEQRSLFQAAALELWSRVQLYWRLQNLVEPRIVEMLAALKRSEADAKARGGGMGAEEFLKMVDEVKPQDAKAWGRELQAFLDNLPAGREALRKSQKGEPHDAKALAQLRYDLVRFEAMSMKGQALLIPTRDLKNSPDDWHSTGDALMECASGQAPNPAVFAWATMADALREGRAADFAAAVQQHDAAMTQMFPVVGKKADREFRFNRLDLFPNTMAIYVFVFMLVLVFWFVPDERGEVFRRSAVWLCTFALLLHTGGIIFRMTLEGRPPVTNLYSAAVFVGWGACVLGLVLERVWKNSIGVAVSAAIGFSTLLVAHHLSLGGDTMEMMRAVLDTNFWLATHVVIINLGYASTYVAGFLALMYIVRGLFTAGLGAELRTSLAKMVYAIICFATLFSFVGTVLGGIWADQSWGRFWGWDPKENGALIIVLWNVLILHARWGGLVRERGLMNLAVVGNIVTTWSFFGTNMLGVGLHSYGFMDQQRVAFVSFCLANLAVLGLGCIPQRFWRSFGGGPPAAA
jgi:ABC-type transport system involved in cytochrome c biogenesis permease subunit